MLKKEILISIAEDLKNQEKYFLSVAQEADQNQEDCRNKWIEINKIIREINKKEQEFD